MSLWAPTLFVLLWSTGFYRREVRLALRRAVQLSGAAAADRLHAFSWGRYFAQKTLAHAPASPSRGGSRGAASRGLSGRRVLGD